MVKQHIIICEEEYCVQILTQILQTQPKSKPGSETRKKNPGVKSEKRGAITSNFIESVVKLQAIFEIIRNIRSLLF